MHPMLRQPMRPMQLRPTLRTSADAIAVDASATLATCADAIEAYVADAMVANERRK